MLLCLPRIHHFYISCPPPPQQPHQCGQGKPGGWEKLRHRWAVHNIVYVPDSSFTQPMPYSPCRHSSVPAKITNTTENETTLLVHNTINVEKMCFRNVVSLLEKYGFTVGEIWFHCWREIRDGIWWQTKLEAPGGYRRLPEAPGGDLKWALAKHWVSESRVGQCLGAPWDALKSRYVPYLSIHSWFWSVRAWKEKFPPFKDIGPPTHFP